MTARTSTPPRPPAGPTRDIHQDVFGALAHELGNVASALNLRADALRSILPPTDHAALHSLSALVQDVNKTLRLLRGPLGDDRLAPARDLSMAEWWRLASRLSASALPRGVGVAATFEPAALPSREAHVLTYLWLAACKALAAGGVQPGTLTLRGGASATHGVELVATLPASCWPGRGRGRGSRWFRYATFMGQREGVTLEWWTRVGAGIVWRCAVQAA